MFMMISNTKETLSLYGLYKNIAALLLRINTTQIAIIFIHRELGMTSATHI